MIRRREEAERDKEEGGRMEVEGRKEEVVLGEVGREKREGGGNRVVA